MRPCSESAAEKPCLEKVPDHVLRFYQDTMTGEGTSTSLVFHVNKSNTEKQGISRGMIFLQMLFDVQMCDIEANA